jgi:hypothetical protein
VEWSPLPDEGLKVQPLIAKRERFALKHFRACFEADLYPLMDRFFFTLITGKSPDCCGAKLTILLIVDCFTAKIKVATFFCSINSSHGIYTTIVTD